MTIAPAIPATPHTRGGGLNGSSGAHRNSEAANHAASGAGCRPRRGRARPTAPAAEQERRGERRETERQRVFPEFQSVEQARCGKGRDQRRDDRAAPRVEGPREPGAARDGEQIAECRQHVDAAHTEHPDRRAPSAPGRARTSSHARDRRGPKRTAPRAARSRRRWSEAEISNGSDGWTMAFCVAINFTPGSPTKKASGRSPAESAPSVSARTARKTATAFK